MDDKYASYSNGLNGPVDEWVTVTPDDNADLPFLPKAIHVAGSGSVVCVSASGSQATFVFGSGEDKRIRPVRILATGTDATGIVALQ